MCAIPPRAIPLTAQQSKWDPENLHRHSDYTAVKKDCVESHAKKSDYSQIKKETIAEFEEIKTSDTSGTIMARTYVLKNLSTNVVKHLLKTQMTILEVGESYDIPTE